MIRSMTGFAEENFKSQTLRLRIFIKTLNHRFFDWVYRGDNLGEMENILRVITQKKIVRGRVEVLLEMDFLSPERWEFKVNRPLLKRIVKELTLLSREVALPFNLTIEQLLRVPQLVSISQKELTREEKTFVLNAFDKALDKIVSQREKEGREISRQLIRHLEKIKKSIEVIESIIKKQPRQLEEKLKRKLQDLNHNSYSEERLSEEVAYLMQKFDVAEEISRIKSHLNSFSELVQPEVNEPVGKKLDFLAQELSREANTLNAKAQDLGIIKHCLQIKNEIESIRQQVQNLE
ncbi:MAG: YicC family protein [Candidatus Aminicenantes bacterium]|nr:YicC family protein [Candidatus Aminicenantes bacterium]